MCIEDDAIEERIEQESKVNQQINFLGYSIICTLISVLIMSYCMSKSSKIPPRPTFAVQAEKGFITEIIKLVKLLHYLFHINH